jgi:uncharacterized UPF0160 family protein
MFKDLASGIKISITRSIMTVFEQYMASIQWDEDKYSLEDFIQAWRMYITTASTWYDKVSDEIKANPSFHEELAQKINETIEKILTTPPTNEQMEEINRLQNELGIEKDYSCKAEAKYVLDVLNEEKKKREQHTKSTPA